MEKVKESTEAKLPDDPKPKTASKRHTVRPDREIAKRRTLVNWEEIGETIEQEIVDRQWTGQKQRRNPRFVMGIIAKHLVKPLVNAIYQLSDKEQK